MLDYLVLSSDRGDDGMTYQKLQPERVHISYAVTAARGSLERNIKEGEQAKVAMRLTDLLESASWALLVVRVSCIAACYRLR